MDEFSNPHHLALEVVYSDEHLMQLEATVTVGRWGGKARAYTTAQNVQAFATELQRFAATLSGEAALVAGSENGIGMVAMRFYAVDRSGHVAGHVRLASEASADRPERIFRLAIEVGVEASSLSGFAASLHRIAETEKGQAVLETELA